MVDKSDFAELNERLEKAVQILDESCDLINKLEFNRTENIRRVGRALGWIFQIQFAIYDRYPDLEVSDLTTKPNGECL